MNKSYFQNIKPLNTIKSYSNHNLSETFNSLSNEDSLNNMIINSNLDNGKFIK